MPAEFLRDVVRPPHAKRSRAWFVLPLSIAAHAVVAIACFIIPLAAEEPPPVPAPLARALHVIAARSLPPGPAPRRSIPSPAPSRGGGAPIAVPTSIEPERAIEPAGSGGSGPPGGVGFDDGVGAGASIGDRVIAAPPAPPPPLERKPVRPGGDIRVPEKIIHVPPVYPTIALQSHVRGVVILEATISEAGRVENLRVLRSHPLLERAAIEAVRQWRYTPTRLNGVPVPVIMTVTVNFVLQP